MHWKFELCLIAASTTPSYKQMAGTGHSLTSTLFISLLLSNRDLKTCLGLS